MTPEQHVVHDRIEKLTRTHRKM
uniref:Uncharacterized protein n=1 Tax=Anguilla anguilla TaxID=7936 RepID=A0A0E9RIA0_ANGAN